jgi:hypothetical protein
MIEPFLVSKSGSATLWVESLVALKMFAAERKVFALLLFLVLLLDIPLVVFLITPIASSSSEEDESSLPAWKHGIVFLSAYLAMSWSSRLFEVVYFSSFTALQQSI